VVSPDAGAVDLGVSYAGMSLKNPILTASGTFGYGQELEGLLDVASLGGLCTKGISPARRSGNPSPRICETASGMINSIGLENVGVDGFLDAKLPYLAGLTRAGSSVWVNFFGTDFDGYVECARRLAEGVAARGGGVAALEMNISCPNVHAGGLEFGTDPAVARKLVRACKDSLDAAGSPLRLLVKLTPNITDVVALARAVADGGADGITLINTLSAMAIDARKRRPRIATIFGGLSGPAIKPVALRMVYQIHRARVPIPICGIGGITSGEDAAEFLLAGASCVQVGTQSFAEPGAAARVLAELTAFCRETGVARVAELIGALDTGDTRPPACIT